MNTRFDCSHTNALKKLPQAIVEYFHTGMIGDPFGYTVSDTITVDSLYAEDVLVGITIHYLDEEGLKFCLFGIDADGHIDLIDYAEPTEDGLLDIVDEMCAIEEDGYYSKAKAWQTMG